MADFTDAPRGPARHRADSGGARRRRVTAIAVLLMVGSGASVAALRLPGLYDRSAPLDGLAEATLNSTQRSLDRHDAEASLVEANVAGAVESPVVPHQTADGPAADSTTVVADIPASYFILYRDGAATCTGLHWSVLAAIGKIESNHGRSTLPGVHTGANPSEAQGPMQFLPSTFDAVTARHPLPPGGATPPSLHNPHDAIYAAAAYLCDNGARDNRDLPGAIYTYNHDHAYVDTVLDTARTYGLTTPSPKPTPSTPAPSTPAPTRSPQPTVAPRVDDHDESAAQKAVAYARAQLGKPYVWGGNGDPGFDCSGLTTAAYAAAGITLPRTAQTQYNRGPRLPAGAALQPGDLLFFGTPRNIHHVGISLGGTRMISAPTFGQTVRVDDYRNFPDYAGASRPAT